MLRFIVPAIAAAGLLVALPAHAADPSAGVYDDTTYPSAAATFTSAPDGAPIVTPDLVYGGVRSAFVNAPAPRDESLLRLATHDDTTYPSATPIVATRVAQEPASAPLACDCLARR